MGDIEISIHEAAIYGAFLASPGRWFTSREIAAAAGVAARTARMHCHRLAARGILDRAATFPAHRYRLAESGEWNADYLRRLESRMHGVRPPRGHQREPHERHARRLGTAWLGRA
jgi:hypothetical protein